jgi:ribosomal protein S18 acetylase RimI-like enzyme
MTHIRPFTPGDEPALAEICLLTAASGGDATGVLDDDEIWGNLFVLPYVAHDPEFAFVVEADDRRVVGYVVAAPDTDLFEQWFHDLWWPRFAVRWPEPTADLTPQDGLLSYAYSRQSGTNDYVTEYPAHLHICLLPEVQRVGWGRHLIETEQDRLRQAGVRGLHLVPLSDNLGALEFYRRVGYTALPPEPGLQPFGLKLR